MVANLIHYVLNLSKYSIFNRPTFTLNHLHIPNVIQYLGIVIKETNCNLDMKRQMCKLLWPQKVSRPSILYYIYSKISIKQRKTV